MMQCVLRTIRYRTNEVSTSVRRARVNPFNSTETEHRLLVSTAAAEDTTAVGHDLKLNVWITLDLNRMGGGADDKSLDML